MQRLLFTLALASFILPPAFSQKIEVNFLQVERRENPVGIDHPNPHFSWQIHTSQKNFLQAAYQVMVSDDSLALTRNIANVWDSRKQTTAVSNGIAFNGKKLVSGKTYFWKVQVWHNTGQASGWSRIHSFTTGLLQPTDWNNAKWIGYADLHDSLVVVPGVHNPDAGRLGNKLRQRTVIPLFRKEFVAKKSIANALIFISGLGPPVLLK